MPIVLAPLNTDLRIVRILATDKLKKHLESLGITIDATIRILSQSGGNVICVVKEGRLALDHDIASKILKA